MEAILVVKLFFSKNGEILIIFENSLVRFDILVLTFTISSFERAANPIIIMETKILNNKLVFEYPSVININFSFSS